MSKYILYDYLQVAGGAERLTLEVARAFPAFAPVVSRIYPDARPFIEGGLVKYSDIFSLGNPVSGRLPRVLEAYLAFNYKTDFLSRADKVIYSGVFAPLAVANQSSGDKYYYCHTTPRFAYDLREYYFSNTPTIAKWLVNLILDQYCLQYEKSLRRMDKIFVNSKTTQRRLSDLMKIKSTIIFPPVDTKKFCWLGEGDYYLSTARLEPKKRVDVIVKAFLRMPNKKLIICSGGSESKRLRSLASEARNIIFTGWQTEEQLHRLIGNSRAIIYIPEDEDFGMSPVEAMSAGKPVIGVANGGILETIDNGKTGILLPKDVTFEFVQDAVEQFTRKEADSFKKNCIEKANEFSRQKFVNALGREIDESPARF